MPATCLIALTPVTPHGGWSLWTPIKPRANKCTKGWVRPRFSRGGGWCNFGTPISPTQSIATQSMFSACEGGSQSGWGTGPTGRKTFDRHLRIRDNYRTNDL